MDKVIVLQPVMAHYRESVYKSLLKSDVFNIEFVAGVNYQNIKSIENIDYKKLNYLSLNIRNHKFYYLKGSLNYMLKSKPDIIISSGIDFHLIHSIFIFLYFRIIRRKKFYWWSHATEGNQGIIGKAFRKFVYKNSTGTLTYNNAGKNLLCEWGINPLKTKVIGNALNTEDYGFLSYPTTVYEKKTSPFTLIFSGRINESKGIDILLKALNELKNTNLNDFICYIIGDGELQQYKDYIKKHSLDKKVIFLGAKYGEEAAKYFLKSDLMVYPKAIGLSLVHAYSFGLPVITTNNLKVHGPEIELLEKGKTGDLYKDGDVNDLTEKILTWQTKIKNSGDVIKNDCINGIKKQGYLPDEIAATVLNFLNNE